MADVTLTYKGSDILELSDSGSATLKTGGKYCEDDVTVEYVKPSGGGGLVLETYTGTIEFTDEDVPTLVIPLDSSDALLLDVAVIPLRTGVVSDGVTTYDDVVTHDSPSSARLIYAVGFTAFREQLSTEYQYKYSSSAPVETLSSSPLLQYHYGYSGNRGDAVKIPITNIVSSAFKSTGIGLVTNNAGYKYCRTGYYMQFGYTVRMLKESA